MTKGQVHHGTVDTVAYRNGGFGTTQVVVRIGDQCPTERANQFKDPMKILFRTRGTPVCEGQVVMHVLRQPEDHGMPLRQRGVLPCAHMPQPRQARSLRNHHYTRRGDGRPGAVCGRYRIGQLFPEWKRLP